MNLTKPAGDSTSSILFKTINLILKHIYLYIVFQRYNFRFLLYNNMIEFISWYKNAAVA